MKYEVLITPGAERDLAELVNFLAAREGRDLAQRILEALLDTAAQLARFPERGAYPSELLALGIHDFRQLSFQPYRLIYRIQGHQVFLYLVADGRRDFQTLLERRLLSQQ